MKIRNVSEKIWGTLTQKFPQKILSFALHAIEESSHSDSATNQNRFKNVRNRIYRYPNGAIYEGDLKDGLPDGRGEFRYLNSGTYKGNFKNGLMHGKGVFYYPSGATYKGDFENNLPNGKGVYHNVTGSTYEGDFKNGELNGKGILHDANGKIYYEGDFQNSLPHGKGVLHYPNKDIYKGHFEYGSPKKQSFFGFSFIDNLYNLYEALYTRDAIPLRNSTFLDLLLGHQKLPAWDCGPRILYSWLNSKPEYQKIANQLISCLDVQGESSPNFQHFILSILSICVFSVLSVSFIWKQSQSNFNFLLKALGAIYLLSIPLLVKENLLRKRERIINKILTDLHEGRSRLLPFGFRGHAMGLNLVPRKPGFIDFEILNSGAGLGLFHPYQSKKFQTMTQVRIPIANITSEIIGKILNRALFTTREAYQLILEIPGAIVIKNQPKSQIWQSGQKGLNCTLEWVFAYLKNSLGEPAYREMRHKLFTDCLLELKKEPNLKTQALQAELARKIAKRS